MYCRKLVLWFSPCARSHGFLGLLGFPRLSDAGIDSHEKILWLSSTRALSIWIFAFFADFLWSFSFAKVIRCLCFCCSIYNLVVFEELSPGSPSLERGTSGSIFVGSLPYASAFRRSVCCPIWIVSLCWCSMRTQDVACTS